MAVGRGTGWGPYRWHIISWNRWLSYRLIYRLLGLVALTPLLRAVWVQVARGIPWLLKSDTYSIWSHLPSLRPGWRTVPIVGGGNANSICLGNLWSSIRATCPNHLSRACVTCCLIVGMPSQSLRMSLLMCHCSCCHRLTCEILRRHIIWNFSHLDRQVNVVVHVSAPYTTYMTRHTHGIPVFYSVKRFALHPIHLKLNATKPFLRHQYGFGYHLHTLHVLRFVILNT